MGINEWPAYMGIWVIKRWIRILKRNAGRTNALHFILQKAIQLINYLFSNIILYFLLYLYSLELYQLLLLLLTKSKCILTLIASSKEIKLCKNAKKFFLYSKNFNQKNYLLDHRLQKNKIFHIILQIQILNRKYRHTCSWKVIKIAQQKRRVKVVKYLF